MGCVWAQFGHSQTIREYRNERLQADRAKR